MSGNPYPAKPNPNPNPNPNVYNPWANSPPPVDPKRVITPIGTGSGNSPYGQHYGGSRKSKKSNKKSNKKSTNKSRRYREK